MNQSNATVLSNPPPQPGATSVNQRAARGARRRRLVRGLRVGASAATLILAWWLAAAHFPSYVLPGPPQVWQAFTDTVGRGVWTAMVGDTLIHTFGSIAIIVVLGLPLGVVIGRSIVAEDLSRMWLIFLQTIPTIVLIAIALIFIGTNTTSVIVVTVISGLTYFLINVVQGTRSIDRDLVEMARSYGATEPAIMRTIMLPSTVPFVLAGARVTLGVAWQITLFAEYLLGSDGVGFQVNSAIKLLDTAKVFMWGLSIVIMTIIFEYGILRPVEAFLTRHQRRG